ncbi:ABC transporter substrate-binding protein [Pseudonocardia kunmingensis]|uniref:Amino acid/amide ABC transporter substrate-binding protein (HAAT family) n=1 Tax=Pseudonocardia kunmingensis TaxID=630975 RepID=A0A543CX00_9PSEU|nr:ABC transporter substrate-binding protein [Pseudonocardia kunmingensis]TQM01636.1 amino acid/amide ABC transporter substrate-binding protein (HAAT family) [Pseudonocardia kunmingensis]
MLGPSPRTRPGFRRIPLVALTASVALALSSCAGSSLGEAQGDAAPETGGPVRVGLLLPTSGVYAPVGADMLAAFELYIEENGGQLGGRDVEVVIADEGGDPATGLPAAQRLVVQEDVDVVAGAVNSATAIAVTSLFNEEEVPLVISNAGADALTGPSGSPYVWRTSFHNSQGDAAAGPWIQAAVGDGVYAIGADYAGGREHVGGFVRGYTEAGGSLAGEVYTPFGTTQDYQPYLTAIANSGAKATYAFFAGAESVRFVQQYKEFGLDETIPLYGFGSLTSSDVLSAIGPPAVGVTTVLHYTPQLDNEANGAFVAAYEAKTSRLPSVYSVQSWDAAQLIDLALASSGGDASGPVLAEAFGEVGEIDSPRGAFTLDGQSPAQPFYMLETQDVDGTLQNIVVDELGIASSTVP